MAPCRGNPSAAGRVDRRFRGPGAALADDVDPARQDVDLDRGTLAGAGDPQAVRADYGSGVSSDDDIRKYLKAIHKSLKNQDT